MYALKIRWIGQSGYILSDGNKTIVIDPYLSDAVNRVAGRKRMVEAPFKANELKCDAVICTHNHLDHVDIDAIPDMDKNIAFYAPEDCEKTLKDCGVIKCNTFDEGDSYKIGEFEITAVFANHTVAAVGVIVRHRGNTLYFSGDTYYDEKLKELKNIDIMFICINGKLGNMDVHDAIKLTKEINPEIAVPNHYGMFESNTENPKKFTSKVENSFEMQYDKEYDIMEVLEKNV